MRLFTFIVTIFLTITTVFGYRIPTTDANHSYIRIPHDQTVTTICPAGYTQPLHSSWNKCYKVFSSSETKRVAANQCLSENAMLASVSDAVINSYIYYLATQSKATSVWLGVECFGEETSCFNDDNTDFRFSNFLEGEPKRTENCIYMSVAGADSQKWAAFECEQKFQFACEANSRKQLIYTCPQDYTEFEGKCYKVFAGPYMTRDEQAERCRSTSSGDLATISNPQLNNFLSNLHSDCPSDHMIRIGLRCAKGSCKWDDGTPFLYQSFSRSDTFSGDSWTCAYFHQNFWGHIDCNMPFLCSACQADMLPEYINRN